MFVIPFIRSIRWVQLPMLSGCVTSVAQFRNTFERLFNDYYLRRINEKTIINFSPTTFELTMNFVYNRFYFTILLWFLTQSITRQHFEKQFNRDSIRYENKPHLDGNKYETFHVCEQSKKFHTTGKYLMIFKKKRTRSLWSTITKH